MLWLGLSYSSFFCKVWEIWGLWEKQQHKPSTGVGESWWVGHQPTLWSMGAVLGRNLWVCTVYFKLHHREVI